MVLMRHPNLPGQIIRAMDQQVQAYQRSGWEPVVDEPEPAPEAPPPTASEDDEGPATAGPSALPDQSPRRRRATTDGDN